MLWEQSEIEQMIINENFQYAVIGKFSYGLPEIQDLSKLLPKQCELKGDCKIGLLSSRHVVIRATLLEDYVHLLLKSTFYIMQLNVSYPMRTLKWDPMFNVEETSIAIAWISFPSVPSNFFGKEAFFSLVVTVGKPFQVDMIIYNQIRPRCASVKVEVDLLSEFPKRIKIGIKKFEGKVMEKWIRIKYDYVPKYRKTCMIQAHDEEQCYVKHLELFKEQETKEYDNDSQNEGRNIDLEEKGNTSR